ncbi:MAG: TRAP transporter small permease [Caldimonas sp.]
MGRWCGKVGEALLAIAMVVMVVMVFGNVVLRYVFDSGITASEEVSRFIFVWLTFAGSILVFAEGGHIAMNTLTDLLTERGRKTCALLSNVAIVGCCALMLMGGWKQTLINLSNVAPVSGISKGAIYGAAVVTAVCIGWMAARNVWRLLRGATAAEMAQHAATE